MAKKLMSPLTQSLPTKSLADYLTRQLETFFPDGEVVSAGEVLHFTEVALGRIAECFRPIGFGYYRDGDAPRFSHLNTDHYATFLYLFSNAAFLENGTSSLPIKAYGLNKALHGLDVHPAVALPTVFLFVHPVGTVIGRATFGNFFAVYQNCTVGGDLDSNCPVFGDRVAMFAGSRVIGKSRVGSDCLIAADTTVIDGTVPDGTTTFGRPPDVRSKPTKHDVLKKVFMCSDPGVRP